MASAPVRDPLVDHLITPQNAAMVLIDYQPAQFAVNWHANVSAIGLAKKQYRQSLR